MLALTVPIIHIPENENSSIDRFVPIDAASFKSTLDNFITVEIRDSSGMLKLRANRSFCGLNQMVDMRALTTSAPMRGTEFRTWKLGYCDNSVCSEKDISGLKSKLFCKNIPFMPIPFMLAVK